MRNAKQYWIAIQNNTYLYKYEDLYIYELKYYSENYWINLAINLVLKRINKTKNVRKIKKT